MGRTSNKLSVPKARKLPSGSWFIQLRLGGESYPITADTEAECIRQAKSIKASVKAGAKLKKKNPSLSERTIEQLMERYISSKRAVLSPSTIRGYETIKDNRFSAYMQKKPPAIKDWQTVINSEVKSGTSAKTIKNSWSLLAASLELAGIAVPSVTLPKIMPAERPWLDFDQIGEFLSVVSGSTCEIPALLALHSLRRSEICGLEWKNVDLDKNVIKVEGSAVFNEQNKLTYKQTTKSKNSYRTIPIMIPRLKTVLQSVPVDDKIGKVVKMNPNTIWAQINRCCKAADLPEVGVHGLRHSFASLAHHVGMPEQEAMLIGGWEDAQTMHKIYEHISEKDRLKSENRMADFYKKLGFSAKNANENANEK